MAITARQFSVGTDESALLTVPPGECVVVISVTGANTAYIGTSAGGSTTSGFPVAGGSPPVTVPGFASSAPTALYAVASGDSTPVGVLVSTPD